MVRRKGRHTRLVVLCPFVVVYSFDSKVSPCFGQTTKLLDGLGYGR